MFLELNNVYDKCSVLRRAMLVIDDIISQYVNDTTWENTAWRQINKIYELVDSILPEPPYPEMLVWGRQLYTYIQLIESILPEPPYWGDAYGYC